MPVIAELQRSLGRVEGKLDALIDATTAHETRREERFNGVEQRIRKVEARQHWYSGAAAAIGALLGVVGGHRF